MKEFYKFNNLWNLYGLSQKDYCIEDKIVTDQIVRGQDFSGCFLNRVDISNCSFLSSSFQSNDMELLTFTNCIFKGVSFRKSNLDNVIFDNC